MSLAPGVRLGPYEVVRLIGAGGMGQVYKARDVRLDRTVAIKVLSEQFALDGDRRARFEREARAVAALNHPHICAVHDVGAPLTSEGTVLGTFPYMAPEQLAGHEADARSDIFAFGAIVHEMATGRR